ncbi:MAG TPA: hypothetical protein ENJ95_21110 [Bacteroidetes bacterium]|nr:hypothetical protein [Bacteroidota bacterium]
MPYPKLEFIACLLVLSAHIAKAQDTIVFENKFPFLVEILEESETKVTYKKFNENPNLAYVINKRFITEIRYQDPEAGKLKFKPDTVQMDKKLEVWVKRMDGRPMVNGLLNRMDDSILILKKKSVLFDGGGRDAPEVVYIFPYRQIKQIEVRKQDQVVKYALLGAAGGFFLGTMTGLGIFKDSPPCDTSLLDGRACDPSLSSPRTQIEKSWLLGFASAGLGALAGGIYGGVKIKIPIYGRKNRYNEAIPKLERFNRSLLMKEY